MKKAVLSSVISCVLLISCGGETTTEKTIYSPEIEGPQNIDSSSLENTDTISIIEIPVEPAFIDVTKFIDTIKLLAFHPVLLDNHEEGVAFLEEINIEYSKVFSEEEGSIKVIAMIDHNNEERHAEMLFEYNESNGEFFNQRHIISDIPDEERNIVVDSLTNWLGTMFENEFQKFEKKNPRGTTFSKGIFWERTDSTTNSTTQIALTTWGEGSYNWIEINKGSMVVNKDQIVY